MIATQTTVTEVLEALEKKGLGPESLLGFYAGGENCLVLVHDPNNQATPYVTWRFYQNGFFWGNYYKHEFNAHVGFMTRQTEFIA